METNTNLFTFEITETETYLAYDIWITDEYFATFISDSDDYFESGHRFIYNIENKTFCGTSTSSYYGDDLYHFESIDRLYEFFGQQLPNTIKTDLINRNLQIDNLTIPNDALIA
jgi:hypothetical protein